MGPKKAFFWLNIFFFRNALINFVSPFIHYFHVYLHWKKSKSQVNVLMKYWQLKKIEILLVKSIFCHNLRTRFSKACKAIFSKASFHRKLQGHKCFHFLSFPEKTIFSSIKKKKDSPYGPVIPRKISEKTNESIPRKLPEGQRNRSILIHQTLPAMAGDPISSVLLNITERDYKLLTISTFVISTSKYIPPHSVMVIDFWPKMFSNIYDMLYLFKARRFTTTQKKWNHL